jgi:hypothetical protein
MYFAFFCPCSVFDITKMYKWTRTHLDSDVLKFFKPERKGNKDRDIFSDVKYLRCFSFTPVCVYSAAKNLK